MHSNLAQHLRKNVSLLLLLFFLTSVGQAIRN